MTDVQVRSAMTRLRLGTFLIFRWLDNTESQFGQHPCAFCCVDSVSRRFKHRFQNTWTLLKSGNDFIIKSAVPLQEYLDEGNKVLMPGGDEITIEEIRSFLQSQMDAINAVLQEMARDMGTINARSDFLRGIDLRQQKRPAVDLSTLEREDGSETRLYRLIASADRVWQAGLVSERQEELTLGAGDSSSFGRLPLT